MSYEIKTEEIRHTSKTVSQFTHELYVQNEMILSKSCFNKITKFET